MKQKEDDSSESFSLSDIAKRVLTVGLGGAAIAKDVISDQKLRKEVLSGILAKAEKRKDDLMEILAREVSKFLGKVDVSEEIKKALTGLIINFKASIDFDEKKGKGLHPTTKIHSADVKKG